MSPLRGNVNVEERKKRELDRFYFVISGELLEGYNNFREQYRNSRGGSDEETSPFRLFQFLMCQFCNTWPLRYRDRRLHFFLLFFFFFRTIPRDNLIKLFPPSVIGRLKNHFTRKGATNESK